MKIANLWRRMVAAWASAPRLIRLVLANALTGAVLGLASAAAVVSTNVGGLRELIALTDDPVAPLALLCIGFASVMASVVAGAAVMTDSVDD